MVKVGISCLAPDTRGKAFSRWPLRIVSAVACHYGPRSCLLFLTDFFTFPDLRKGVHVSLRLWRTPRGKLLCLAWSLGPRETSWGAHCLGSAVGRQQRVWISPQVAGGLLAGSRRVDLDLLSSFPNSTIFPGVSKVVFLVLTTGSDTWPWRPTPGSWGGWAGPPLPCGVFLALVAKR